MDKRGRFDAFDKMSESQEKLLREVLAELTMIRHELRRVAGEHEHLRTRVDALETARDPFPSIGGEQ